VTELQPASGVVKAVVQPLSILFFDVEVSLAEIRGFPERKPQYIRHHQIKVGQYMHCWAAKWQHQSKILADRQTSSESLARDDSRIAESLAALVRQADVVVAHNSDGFDVPRLRNRLIIHNKETLGPVATIDTLKVARKLGFAHNNLDALARDLGLEGKLDNPRNLWDQAFDGSDMALQQMLRYCRNDVVILAQIYERLKPHAVKLPRLVDGEGSFCPYCGSQDYQKRGLARTNAGTKQRFQCNGCSRYFSDKSSDAGKSQMRTV
jgi:DNA polymerase elongation subunit (family B)